MRRSAPPSAWGTPKPKFGSFDPSLWGGFHGDCVGLVRVARDGDVATATTTASHGGGHGALGRLVPVPKRIATAVKTHCHRSHRSRHHSRRSQGSGRTVTSHSTLPALSQHHPAPLLHPLRPHHHLPMVRNDVGVAVPSGMLRCGLNVLEFLFWLDGPAGTKVARRGGTTEGGSGRGRAGAREGGTSNITKA